MDRVFQVVLVGQLREAPGSSILDRVNVEPGELTEKLNAVMAKAGDFTHGIDYVMR
jgi:hypothetical protein